MTLSFCKREIKELNGASFGRACNSPLIKCKLRLSVSLIFGSSEFNIISITKLVSALSQREEALVHVEEELLSQLSQVRTELTVLRAQLRELESSSKDGPNLAPLRTLISLKVISEISPLNGYGRSKREGERKGESKGN
jgi:hypothetical protein